MSRLARMVTLTLLTLVLVSGCTRAPAMSADEKAIRATIVRYNELLSQGYRSLNMNPIQEVATQLQSEDEYIYMSSLAEGGVRLDPELVDQKFTRVSVETTSAEAETTETWNYRHYDRKTGKLVLEQKDLVYRLAWDLEKHSDGRWYVSDLRAIDATTSVPPTVGATRTPSPLGGP